MTHSPGTRPRILPADVVVDCRADGVVYARSPHGLGPYPAKITERLDHWAAAAPSRTFLAQRDGRGEWRRLTYGEAHGRVRAIAQALLDRGLRPDRPIVLLSGNGIEHALLALASMYCGVPYAPLAPAYSILAQDFTTLRSLWAALEPAIVFAGDGPTYARALATLAGARTEIVTCTPVPDRRCTPFADLDAAVATPRVDDAHARVSGDTVAKILYTSGSTGRPKGVVNTQRMLCANQEMIRTALPLVADPPPVLCDWLPWNHTFGGNHNFGIVLYNGGTMYIDAGKPTPAMFGTTLANLREVATTAYFNVPRGFDLLVPQLREDEGLRAHFFSRLGMLFCAAAALRQRIADDLQAMAFDANGRRIPLVTGLGATESAPFALCAGDAAFTGGRVGVPVPGVELKLAPVGEKLEARLRGPTITPGYWRDPAATAAAFDAEGFYRLGDAVGFFDPADPAKGFVFEGRLAEDFKLSTGTWVRVGPLRAKFLAHAGDLVHDVVFTAPDRDFVGALIFPNLDACRALRAPGAGGSSPREILDDAAVRARFAGMLTAFALENRGSSAAPLRAVLLEEPPSLDAQEATEKASVNQKAVLVHRAALVDQVYGAEGHGILVDVSAGGSNGGYQD